jgi:hypothetical protein
MSSINRPGGNMTGVSFAAEIIAILQDPASATYQTETREIQTTVGAMEKKIITFKAASEQEINAEPI